MTSSPDPYVLLPGTARDALAFYQQTFGGELEMHTFADFGRQGPPDDIAHGVLRGPVVLFAADAGPDEDSFSSTGLMFALLGVDEPATLHTWFDALTVGGQVIEPLEERPWGASDGQVRDQFGLRWLIGYAHT